MFASIDIMDRGDAVLGAFLAYCNELDVSLDFVFAGAGAPLRTDGDEHARPLLSILPRIGAKVGLEVLRGIKSHGADARLDRIVIHPDGSVNGTWTVPEGAKS